MTEPTRPGGVQLAPSFPDLDAQGRPIREGLCYLVMADPSHFLPYK
jgi:hypothetical protein